MTDFEVAAVAVGADRFKGSSAKFMCVRVVAGACGALAGFRARVLQITLCAGVLACVFAVT